MDLEDELNRLFKDDRLNMRVAADADANVVKGAKRVRRRRMVAMSAAGVLSAVVITGGAVMLAQPAPQSSQVANQPSADLSITSGVPDSTSTSPLDSPTTKSETSITTSPKPGVEGTPAPPPTAAAPETLGPTGLGKVRLGMTATDLKTLQAKLAEEKAAEDKAAAERKAAEDQKRTGQSQLPTPESTSSPVVPPTQKTTTGCTAYPWTTPNGTVWVGRAGTVVALTYYSGVVTPERVTIGSPQDAVKTAYRDFTGTSVKVPGNANARYQFTFSAGKVTGISLLEVKQECVS